MNITVKDVLRYVFITMLSGSGFNPDGILFRLQAGIAIYMTPGYLPFF